MPNPLALNCSASFLPLFPSCSQLPSARPHLPHLSTSLYCFRLCTRSSFHSFPIPHIGASLVSYRSERVSEPGLSVIHRNLWTVLPCVWNRATTVLRFLLLQGESFILPPQVFTEDECHNDPDPETEESDRKRVSVCWSPYRRPDI